MGKETGQPSEGARWSWPPNRSFVSSSLRAAEDEEEAEDDGVAEMFRALDTDSDGKIARDEMLATVLQEAPADWRRSSTSPTRTGT